MDLSILFKPDPPIWNEVQARLSSLEKDNVLKAAILCHELWDEIHKSYKKSEVSTRDCT